MSASLGLSPNLSPIWLCLSPWLGCCVRLAGLANLSPNLSPIWLCLSPWLGCCVRLAGLANFSPIWLCLSPWLGCCVRLAGLVSQFVSHLALSFTLAGVLCPPRWACLPICLPPGFVFHLGWGAVSASLGLSPNPPNSLRCVRLAGLVSGLVSQLVSHLVWDAVSASLVLSFSCLRSCLPSWLGCCVRLTGLSPVLSPSLSPIWSGTLCPPPWSCLSLFSGLVSQLLSLFCLVACLSSPGLVFFLSLVLSPSLSPIWSGMLCPPRWSCLSLLCGLVSGLVCHLGRDAMLCPPCWAVSGLFSQLVSHLVWDAVSASLVLSFSCLRSCLRSCLPSWLGCSVRIAGLSPVLSPSLSPIWSGMLCPPPWSCLSLVSGLVSQLLSLFCLVACRSFIWDAASAPAGLVFFLSPSLSGMPCSPSWLVSQPSLSPVFCPILFSSWSGVSVLWACLQNFMCDLCNCVGSTVV